MASFKVYGKENFSFEILWKCEPKDCLYFEQLYLDYYEPWEETGKGYNRSKIAGKVSAGIWHHSDETKNSIREFQLIHQNKPEVIENKSKWSTYYNNKPEIKNKLIERMSGENSPTKRPEVRLKLKEANIGKIHSTKTKVKQKEAKKNIMRSVKRIDKITGEIKEYLCIMDAERDGFCRGDIWRCCNNKPHFKSHKGYLWKYLNET